MLHEIRPTEVKAIPMTFVVYRCIGVRYSQSFNALESSCYVWWDI